MGAVVCRRPDTTGRSSQVASELAPEVSLYVGVDGWLVRAWVVEPGGRWSSLPKFCSGSVRLTSWEAWLAGMPLGSAPWWRRWQSALRRQAPVGWTDRTAL